MKKYYLKRKKDKYFKVVNQYRRRTYEIPDLSWWKHRYYYSKSITFQLEPPTGKVFYFMPDLLNVV